MLNAQYVDSKIDRLDVMVKNITGIIMNKLLRIMLFTYCQFVYLRACKKRY